VRTKRTQQQDDDVIEVLQRTTTHLRFL